MSEDWEGDWRGAEGYVVGLFPDPGSNLPGLPGPPPWPAAIQLMAGPRAGQGTVIAEVDYDGESEPRDFAYQVVQRIRSHLDNLPGDRSGCSISVEPLYSEDDTEVEVEPFRRQFTRRLMLVRDSRGERTSPVAGIHEALVGANGPLVPTGGAGSGGAGNVGTNSSPLPTDIYEPRTHSNADIESMVARGHFIMLAQENDALRRQTAQLTSQVVAVLGSVVENSGKDAERFAAEAHAARASASSVEKLLFETAKERDILRVNLENSESELEALRELVMTQGEEKARQKKKRRKPVGANAETMFQSVVERAVAAIRDGSVLGGGGAAQAEAPQQEAQAQAPEAHPAQQRVLRKRRRVPPGAPPSGGSGGGGGHVHAHAHAPAAPPAAGGLGGLASMFGGGDVGSPGKIASVIAMMPEGMRTAIVGQLVEQYPGVAVTLGDELYKESEKKVRAAKRAQGIPEEDEGDDDGDLEEEESEYEDEESEYEDGEEDEDEDEGDEDEDDDDGDDADGEE